MAKQRFLNNSDMLLVLSAVLSIATVALHCLALTVFLGKGDHLLTASLLWAMSVGALVCGVRALWVLYRQAKAGLPRPLLGPIPAVFLIGLGSLLTLAESLILYINTMPDK